MTRQSDREFGAFYAEHAGGVRRLVARLLRRPADVEDVTNDAFTQTLKAHQAGKEVTDGGGYVYTAARNLAKNRLRNQTVRAEPGDREELIARAASETADSERALIGRERVALLKQAFAELPALQREIILLRKMDGLSIKAIADRTGMSVSYVEKQIRYGLRACQDYLDAHEDEAGIDHALRATGQVRGQQSGG